MAVNEKEKKALAIIPPSDVNFGSALKLANAETIMATLAEIEGQPGHKVREKALRAQLARLSKDHHDQATEAATEVVEMELAREVNVVNEQAERERRIAESYEIAGRIQAFTFVEKVVTVSTLVQLKKMKESKVYRDLPNIGTWDKYCQYLGLDRHSIDQQLLNLAVFGEGFLETCHQFSIGYRDLRKLRQLTHDGGVVIDAEAVEIDGERIPLTPDHREDLQAALERVIETNAKIIADKDATIKAKEKVLKDKQTLIERQARELTKLEDEAAAAEMTPIEEAFVRKMENLRVSFDGYMLKVDPERCELSFTEERTARMAAAYLTTLDYMRKQLLVAYDVAQDLYGSITMSPEEAGWTQPEE